MTDHTVDKLLSIESDSPSASQLSISKSSSIPEINMSSDVQAPRNGNPSDASLICDSTAIDSLAVSNLASMDDPAEATTAQMSEISNTKTDNSPVQTKLKDPSPDDGLIRLKVICLGDSAVGKSKLVERFLLDGYKQQSLSTYALTTFQHKTTVDGETVVVDIWDTAGQEKFNNLHPSYYHDAHACVMVFDCTRKITYKNLVWWYKELKQYRPEIPCLCAANKIDANPTATKRSFQIPQKLDIPLYYVSASDGTNVVKLFNDAIKSALMYKKNPTDFFDRIMEELEALEFTDVSADESSEKSKDMPVEGQGETSVDKPCDKPIGSPIVKDTSDENGKNIRNESAKDPSNQDPSDENGKNIREESATDPSNQDPNNKPVDSIEKDTTESPNKEMSDESATPGRSPNSSFQESCGKHVDLSEEGSCESSISDRCDKLSDSPKSGSQKSPVMLHVIN